MEPTELRKGNCILNKDNEPDIVGGIWYELSDNIDEWDYYIQCGLNHLDYPISDIKPIPLTDEWLKNFGFEKREKYVGHGINDLLYEWSLNGYTFSEDVYGKWFLCGYNWNTERMSYVHQLQNIYFALSGEELSLLITR